MTDDPRKPADQKLRRFATPSFEFDWDGGDLPILWGRGRLGVSAEEVSGQLAAYFGVESGVLVRQVDEDSAAAKAGVKAGDVITAVNGKAVKDAGELRRQIADATEGDQSERGHPERDARQEADHVEGNDRRPETGASACPPRGVESSNPHPNPSPWSQGEGLVFWGALPGSASGRGDGWSAAGAGEHRELRGQDAGEGERRGIVFAAVADFGGDDPYAARG